MGTRLVTGVAGTLVSLPQKLGFVNKEENVSSEPETAATESQSSSSVNLFFTTDIPIVLEDHHLKALNMWWCGHALGPRLELLNRMRQRLQHCSFTEQTQCRRIFRQQVRIISRCPQEHSSH